MTDLLTLKAGAASVDPDDFNALVDATVAEGGGSITRKAGAAAVDTDDFNALVDAVVGLGGSVLTRKAGAAAVDPDDFNALVEAVAAIQVDVGLSVTEGTVVTLASGENLIHGFVNVPGVGLFASTRTSPAKLIKWADPDDLATYTVLTFPNTGGDSGRHNEGDSLAYSSVTGKLYLSFKSATVDPPDAMFIRVARIDPAAMTQTTFIDEQVEDVFSVNVPAIAVNSTHLFLITGGTIYDSKVRKYLLTDGSLIGSRTITGYKNGHTCCVDATGVYVAGSIVGGAVPWAAKVALDLSAHTVRELSASTAIGVTDDAFVTDDYFVVGLEKNAAQIGEGRRIAKDMLSHTIIDFGIDAACYGTFDLLGEWWFVLNTSPGTIGTIDPVTLEITNTFTLSTGLNSPNELVVNGTDLIATCFLSPAKVIALEVSS